MNTVKFVTRCAILSRHIQAKGNRAIDTYKTTLPLCHSRNLYTDKASILNPLSIIGGHKLAVRYCSYGDRDARHNYHIDCEQAVNKQINIELYNYYVYQSMAFFFNRDYVSLLGFHNYFKKAAADEMNHAEQLMYYQNKRGGCVMFDNIQKPERDDWGTGLEAMQAALKLEKDTNDSLFELYKVAERHGDINLMRIVDDFLEEQVGAIKELADHVTNLKRVGPGLGKYKFDKDVGEKVRALET